jgi:hypothetical protein
MREGGFRVLCGDSASSAERDFRKRQIEPAGGAEGSGDPPPLTPKGGASGTFVGALGDG